MSSTLTLQWNEPVLFAEDGAVFSQEAWRGIQSRFAIQARIAEEFRAGSHAYLGLGNQEDLVGKIDAWAAPAREKFRRVLLLGIGGSALGYQAVHQALTGRYGSPENGKSASPEILVFDNVDPWSAHQIFSTTNWKETLVLVVSKSGGTLETLSALLTCWEHLSSEMDEGEAREHVVVITDPEAGPLRKWARERQMASFEVPPPVGGRFSVLTPVGLVPLALAGHSLKGILRGAAAAADRFLYDDPEGLFPFQLAGLAYLAATTHRMPIWVFMPYADCLHGLAMWVRQLWAESLGKSRSLAGEVVHAGSAPCVAVGATDQHSQIQIYVEGPQDTFITFLEVQKFPADPPVCTKPPLFPEYGALQGKTYGEVLNAELEATRQALTEARRPHCTLVFPEITAETIGEFLMGFELATTVGGMLWNVNPYDQPGVETGKIFAKKRLGL